MDFFQVLPTDIVAQLVERRRDMPKDLGSNHSECHIFLFVPLRSFFLCYPGEALEGPISTGVAIKLSNNDSNNGILISKNTILNKLNQLWSSIEKTSVNNKKHVVQKVHTT